MAQPKFTVTHIDVNADGEEKRAVSTIKADSLCTQSSCANFYKEGTLVVSIPLSRVVVITKDGEKAVSTKPAK